MNFFFFTGAYVVWIGLYLAPSKNQCVVLESVGDVSLPLLEREQLHVKLLMAEFPAVQQAESSTMVALLGWSGNCLSDEQVAALLVQRERERERKRGVNSVRLPQLCPVSAFCWMLFFFQLRCHFQIQAKIYCLSWNKLFLYMLEVGCMVTHTHSIKWFKDNYLIKLFINHYI